MLGISLGYTACLLSLVSLFIAFINIYLSTAKIIKLNSMSSLLENKYSENKNSRISPATTK